MTMAADDIVIERALRGEILYGDDFSTEEIDRWFEDEREGYFRLYGDEIKNPASAEGYEYEYGKLAEAHCYRWLPHRSFEKVLGIGSAGGADLEPIIPVSRKITILEPSDGFAASSIAGKAVTYVKPAASGTMPFESECFDLIVCFSVLHHIPNISHVVREMYRVMKPGGWALLREPTHSLGDWRKPRRGLTKNERGIPLALFRRMLAETGFEMRKETRCMFSLMSRLSFLMRGRSLWTSKAVVNIDQAICALPIWSDAYGSARLWHKIRPTAVSFVLEKPC